MTSTVFAAAIETAQARQTEQARLQQEQRAARAAQKRAVAAQQQAAAEERRREQEAERLRQLRDETFCDGFFLAVVKAGSKWSPQTLVQAQAYCEALASIEGVPLPTLDPTVEKVIRDKFTYGIVRAGSNVPEGRFNGQRQDWFPELFAATQSKAPDSVRRALKHGGPTIEETMANRGNRVVYSSVTAVAEQPPAVTAPQKRNPRHRKAARNGYKLTPTPANMPARRR